MCFVDGYDVTDVMYVWTNGVNSSIKMASDMRLSQFDLIAFPAGFDFMNDSSGPNHIAHHGASYSTKACKPFICILLVIIAGQS